MFCRRVHKKDNQRKRKSTTNESINDQKLPKDVRLETGLASQRCQHVVVGKKKKKKALSGGEGKKANGHTNSHLQNGVTTMALKRK